MKVGDLVKYKNHPSPLMRDKLFIVLSYMKGNGNWVELTEHDKNVWVVVHGLEVVSEGG